MSVSDRARLWEATLRARDLTVADDVVADVVQQFHLGPEAIVRTVDEAVAFAELHGSPAPDREHLWSACRAWVGRELGELASRLEPTQTWDQLVLPEAERALLRAIAAQVAQRPRVYEEWGFGARLSRGRGITALFSGPPGTGKTMAAEIIAGQLELDLYRIDLSSVVSKYIGETEKNLRRLFDAAEQGGVILLFDEGDALFGKRTEVKDSHDRYANIEVNYLLQRMEEYSGLAILATNRKADLDPAFLRRIRFVVTFPFPDEDHRRRIWGTVFPPETPLGDLDYDALARLEIAGGNIRNIAVNAAFLAADASEPVGMTYVMRAARHEYEKVDRRPSGVEFGRYYKVVIR
jgi:SpoVK/Ycf46/Vps4 family AAA+-type ATPase